MDQKSKAEIISKRLNELYPKPKIPLSHTNEFTLLIAVLLSAQCTDKKVNEITPDLFRKADNPELMIDLGKENILNIIRPIGLSKTKASHIYRLSLMLRDYFNSNVPEDLEALKTLPGVGHKTASVVMAQAFGIPSFPVDTHIHRLSQRWGLSSGKNVKQTEKDLKRIFKKSEWNRLHLQMIYYGREYCTARGCKGIYCDLCKELYPERTQPIITQKP